MATQGLVVQLGRSTCHGSWRSDRRRGGRHGTRESRSTQDATLWPQTPASGCRAAAIKQFRHFVLEDDVTAQGAWCRVSVAVLFKAVALGAVALRAVVPGAVVQGVVGGCWARL